MTATGFFTATRIHRRLARAAVPETFADDGGGYQAYWRTIATCGGVSTIAGAGGGPAGAGGAVVSRFTVPGRLGGDPTCCWRTW